VIPGSPPAGGGGGGRFNQGFNFATTTPKSFFYDLNGKITFKPTQKDILTLSVYNGTDNMDNSRTNSFGGGGGFGGGGFGRQNFKLHLNGVTDFQNRFISIHSSLILTIFLPVIEDQTIRLQIHPAL